MIRSEFDLACHGRTAEVRNDEIRFASQDEAINGDDTTFQAIFEVEDNWFPDQDDPGRPFVEENPEEDKS